MDLKKGVNSDIGIGLLDGMKFNVKNQGVGVTVGVSVSVEVTVGLGTVVFVGGSGVMVGGTGV